MNTYPEGSTVRVAAQFYSDSEPADPTSLTLIVNGRLDIELTQDDVVKDTVGVYHFDLANLEHGVYTYYWRGYGNLITFEGEQFTVDQFKMDL